jgi:hypothetical protein
MAGGRADGGGRRAGAGGAGLRDASSAGDTPPPPPDVLTVLRTLAIDRVAAEVVGALRAAGIHSILLKGASFVWLYDDGPPRAYGDCDLLVAPRDIERGEEVLRALGFEHPPLDDLPHDKPWHAHAWNRPGDPSIDLHRTLIGVGVTPEELWSVLSARAERMTVAGTEVAILDGVARAMHIALHAAQDGQRVRRPLGDLERAVSKIPEAVWRDAAGLASRLDATQAFAAGLRLHPAGSDIAGRLGLPPDRSVEVILRSTGAPQVAVGIDWLMRTPGVGRKTQLVVRKLFPPRPFMRAWSPLARRGAAGLAAAYVWRPVWLLTRAGPGMRAWRRARKLARDGSGRAAAHRTRSREA